MGYAILSGEKTTICFLGKNEHAHNIMLVILGNKGNCDFSLCPNIAQPCKLTGGLVIKSIEHHISLLR